MTHKHTNAIHNLLRQGHQVMVYLPGASGQAVAVDEDTDQLVVSPRLGNGPDTTIDINAMSVDMIVRARVWTIIPKVGLV